MQFSCLILSDWVAILIVLFCLLVFLLHFGKETSTKGCSPSMLDLCKKLFLGFI